MATPGTAATGPGEDEGYDESLGPDYVNETDLEVFRGVLENGRLYPSYGMHEYGLPVDEQEQRREWDQHEKYYTLLNGRLYLSPISSNPQQILDLGTGIGKWALEMADLFPSAIVTGVDKAPIQPSWVGPNCIFEIDDIEMDWMLEPKSFDFIHSRDLFLSIRNWPRLIQQAYTALKPGGYLELSCAHLVPLSDDNSLPPDSGLPSYWATLREAGYLYGTSFDVPLYFKSMMEEKGFENVQEHVFKLPSNPWPAQPRMKALGTSEMENIIQGASAFSLRVFEACYGWSKATTELFLLHMKHDIRSLDYHSYCN